MKPEMKLKRIHHVAYRCKDAKETVEFYQRVLNMDFQIAFAENRVPSTKEPDPYMHVFLDAGMGNILAFFELPTKEPMDRDHNTHNGCNTSRLKLKTMMRCSKQSSILWTRGLTLSARSTTVFSSQFTSSIPMAIGSNSSPIHRHRNRLKNFAGSRQRCSRSGVRLKEHQNMPRGYMNSSLPGACREACVH